MHERAFFDPRLYVLVGGDGDAARAVAVARAAVDGGATMLQVRAKRLQGRALLDMTRAVMKAIAGGGVAVVVNDRVDVAHAADADGVHLGPDDLPLTAARTLLGPRAILGFSAGTAAEATAAEREGADYLGVGDIFGTTTKPDADPPIGLDGLRAVVRATALPCIGIGGVDAHRAAAVLGAGARGVAVASAVAGAADPATAARTLRRAIDDASRDDNSRDEREENQARTTQRSADHVIPEDARW